MFKKILQRAALGFPLGICLSYLITIGISLGLADGYFSPCPPSLVEQFGNEITAVIFQTILAGIMGAAFAGASVVWEMETWSYAKQTGIYFLVGSIAMLPVAYFAHWMEQSLRGIISFYAIFILIFIVIWIVMRFIWKKQIRQVNEGLKGGLAEK